MNSQHLKRIAVHPHGCGERPRSISAIWRRFGSSPRVWGTPMRHSRPFLPTRFIPTGVGNAAVTPPVKRNCTVHPHGCGERKIFSLTRCHVAGSSPRVWGTLGETPGETREARFIPTGVGNATTTKRPGPVTSVHPHGCGERCICAPVWLVICGSSPRVWGTLNSDF